MIVHKKMKALSVVTRAGQLISSGKKSLEIRSWRPDECPIIDLAIVQNERRLTREEPIDPNGVIVAIVDVLRIREWKKEDAEASCSEWEEGWLAWDLTNIRKVVDGPAVPAKRRIYKIETTLDELKTSENQSVVTTPEAVPPAS